MTYKTVGINKIFKQKNDHEVSRDQTFLHEIVYCSQIEKKEFLKLDFLKVGFYTADSNYIPLYYESGYYMELCRPHFQTDEISFN